MSYVRASEWGFTAYDARGEIIASAARRESLAEYESARPLSEIAREIISDYPKAGDESHPAGAYVVPMLTLDKITDSYFLDSADSIVRYALANLGTWRGEKARAVKAELKGMLK